MPKQPPTGDPSAILRYVADEMSSHQSGCEDCLAGVGLLRQVADDLDARPGSRAWGALGGASGRGKSKRRGGKAHYRALALRSVAARRKRLDL